MPPWGNRRMPAAFEEQVSVLRQIMLLVDVCQSIKLDSKSEEVKILEKHVLEKTKCKFQLQGSAWLS